MVYYFKSIVTDPPTIIYVGKDKFESSSAPFPPRFPFSPNSLLPTPQVYHS